MIPIRSRPIASIAASLAIAACAAFGATKVLAAEPLSVANGVLGLTATASIEVPQDTIAITMSTSKEGSDANAVQAQLKQALDAALAEAKKDARPGQVDVRTGSFSLFPRYAAKGGINGWQGTAEVVVEGRDIAAIGALSGRMVTMTVANVAFRLSRDAGRKVEGDVVAEAIVRYRAHAADYAKQFGYAGYAIREVTVSTGEGSAGPIPGRQRMAVMSSAVSSEPLAVEPGKSTVTATVSGTVQMK